VAAAADRLARLPYADLGFARVDHHRPLRQGMRAVYRPGGTPGSASPSSASCCSGDDPVVLTGASDEQRAAVEAATGRARVGHDDLATRVRRDRNGS
jgi:hypothetical protein